MVTVPAQPEVLVWAREESGISREDALSRLGQVHEDLLAFEEGREPVSGESGRAARCFRAPHASSLMSAASPEICQTRLEDFRTANGAAPKDLSRETSLAIHQAFSLLCGLEAIRRADPALVPRKAPTSYRITDDPIAVAAAERLRLGIRADEQLGWRTDRDALMSWREALEEQGVFAYELKLGADGTRGFAIWDERELPIVAIDASESYRSKAYAICHEYAHILIRSGGISDQNTTNAVEIFCNQFAASLLMPEREFKRESAAIRQSFTYWSENHVARLAARFHVSTREVALRLEELGVAPTGFSRATADLWRLRHALESSARDSIVESYVNRFGGHHIEVIGNAVLRGAIGTPDACDMLGVTPQDLDALVREASQRRRAYGRPA